MQNSIRAVHSNARISPYKARLVADAVRNMNASQAGVLLKFSPLKGAKLFRKLLLSAIANAENNLNVADIENFYISSVTVDEGKSMKRFKPRARGRADRIIKRSSHLKLELDHEMGRLVRRLRHGK